MPQKIIAAFLDRIFQSLTLRLRLALWTAGLLFFLGLGLTVFTNVIATIRVPQVLTVELVPTQKPPDDQVPSNTSPKSSLNNSGEQGDYSKSLKLLQETTISEIRFITIIGAILFSMIGALGVHWISKQALLPIRHLNCMVSEIQASSLDQRLSLKGPEDEIRQLSDTFDNMLERLERSFDQQGRFIADAAHELRTPLANMRINLEVIQQDPQATKSDFRELLNAFDRSLRRLEGLVEDFLLLAKGEKEIQRKPTNIGRLLSNAMKEAEAVSRGYQVSLELNIKDDINLAVDASLLSLAFRNMILNGIQYNSPGGIVLLTIQATNGSAVVKIEDTGVGISESDLAHIFDRFHRVDKSRARHLGGAGLGLSIASHIVELHGGRIEAESSPGIGSCFTVHLPPTENQEAVTQNLT